MRHLFWTDRRALPWYLLLVVAGAVLGSGCGGINASKSISPLDFLLPGLHIENRPKAPLLENTNSVAANPNRIEKRG